MCMLGLFIFSLALHFLASPAVRNQVKPVEKVAEVVVHNWTILLCSLDVRNIDDPHRNPKMNTRIIELGN